MVHLKNRRKEEKFRAITCPAGKCVGWDEMTSMQTVTPVCSSLYIWLYTSMYAYI